VLLALSLRSSPMVVNTFAGIQGTDPIMLRMARSFSASRWTVFRKIEFPNALPYIFSGLKIGSPSPSSASSLPNSSLPRRALVISSFAEGNVNTPLLMAAVVVLSLIGVILYGAIVLLEKLVIRWDVGQKF
jgi:NitT/TauT family transport system permease protein